MTFALAGEDVHALGSLAPLIDGYIGCVVIRRDGSRYLARAVPDPLAQQRDQNSVSFFSYAPAWKGASVARGWQPRSKR